MHIGGGLLPFASPADHAAARKQPHPAPGDAAPRRPFEVKVLLCFLPEPLRVLFAPCLLTLAGTHLPLNDARVKHVGSALVWLRFRGEMRADDLAWLRRALLEELHLGLALAETPMSWCARPVRNLRLLMRAARVGQLAEALAAHPDALPLTDELYHALWALRRTSRL
jgi:hypothetical protein